VGIIFYNKKRIILIKDKKIYKIKAKILRNIIVLDYVKKKSKNETKKIHYELTRNFFRKNAISQKGYYDAKNVNELKHDFKQNKMWEICTSFIDIIVNNKREYKNIIDVGCGIGDFTIDLVNRYSYFKKIVGIDFLDEVIDLAKKNANKCDKVTFLKGDMLNLPFENRSFDISICINVIHHIYIKDLELSIKELARITDKYMIIEIRNKKNIFNFWFKYFSLPILYKNLPVFSCSITELNEILKNYNFKLKNVKGIYPRTWICRRLLLIYKRANID